MENCPGVHCIVTVEWEVVILLKTEVVMTLQWQQSWHHGSSQFFLQWHQNILMPKVSSSLEVLNDTKTTAALFVCSLWVSWFASFQIQFQKMLIQ